MGNDSQMALLLQQQQQQQQGNNSNNTSLEQMVANANGLNQQRNSIGLNGGSSGQSTQMEQLLRQQQQIMQGAGGGSQSGTTQQEIMKGQQEQAALEDRLQKLKEDIARRQQEAEDLHKAAGRAGDVGGGDGVLGGDKRKRNGKMSDAMRKLVKLENNVVVGGGNEDGTDV